VDLKTELKITWFRNAHPPTLDAMSERSVKPGRPEGAKTSDPVVAAAFGSALRAARLEHNLAQEALAHSAGVERSHVGKIERGEHMPTMAIALKLAVALGLSLSELVIRMEAELKRGGRAAPKR
jgi:ribosome-binding protein aMBF1 (putative translation factor)